MGRLDASDCVDREKKPHLLSIINPGCKLDFAKGSLTYRFTKDVVPNAAFRILFLAYRGRTRLLTLLLWSFLPLLITSHCNIHPGSHAEAGEMLETSAIKVHPTSHVSHAGGTNHYRSFLVTRDDACADTPGAGVLCRCQK